MTFERTAEAVWEGDVVRGNGVAHARTGAFHAKIAFPTLRGEPAATTTPEELLAAAHATCYAIGLRSVIGRNGGSADRVAVTATITGEKSAGGIRILGSQLAGIVEGLSGLDSEGLARCADETRRECSISMALRETIAITHEVVSAHATSR